MTDSFTLVAYFVVGCIGLLVIAGLQFLAAWLLAMYGERQWRKRAQRRGGYIFDRADYPHDFVASRHE